MAEHSLLKKIADNFLELSERERQMMKERFGIEMPRTPTLEEVQRAFEKTRDKLREIEERVLSQHRKAPDNDDGGASPADSPNPKP
jgi:DNA-directed RNA polymerase sigma subunit (sigma70/sigma32)